jgi:hypothetical protein
MSFGGSLDGWKRWKKVGGRHAADLLLQLPATGRPTGSAAFL